MVALLQRRKATAWHGPLTVCAVAMAVLAVVSGIGLVVDGRTVMGEGVWLKPFKFSVSFGLYAITLAWMINNVRRWPRTLWWLGTITVAVFVLPEISAITFQAVRGVRSHFNFATTLDESVFMVMGGAAYLGWLLTLVLGIFLVLQRRVDRAMAWAIPLGVIISLAGMSSSVWWRRRQGSRLAWCSVANAITSVSGGSANASRLVASVVLRVNTTTSSRRPPTKSRTASREPSYASVVTCDLYPAPRCTLEYQGSNSSKIARAHV